MQSKQEQLQEFESSPLLQSIGSGSWVGSNEEILQSIEELRAVLREERLKNPELTTQGLGISSAIDRVLKSSQTFLSEKNSDEAFQKFFNHAVTFGKTVKAEVDFNKVKDDPSALELSERFSNTIDSLKEVVIQLFTSKKERDIVRNLEKVITKFYEIFGDVENVNFDDISKEKREDLVKTLLSFYSGYENVPAMKQLRNNVLGIFDFWREGLEGVRPDFRKEFEELFDEALTILDRFTEKNVFDLKKKFVTAHNLLVNDKEAVVYFRGMRRLTDDVINNPKLANQKETIQRGNELIGQYVDVRNKFFPQLKDFYTNLKDVLHSFQEERYLREIKYNVGGIGESLRSGTYLGTLIQLKTILAPVLSSGLKQAQLKPIKQEDDVSSWTLTNLHLAKDETNLDDIVVTAKIGLKDILKIKLSVKKIDLLFKDVNFDYERRSVPSWTDTGKLDIKLTSPSWKLKWIVNQKEGRDPFFELQQANATVKSLDISVTQANHTWIDSLLLQVWSPSIRRGAQDSIERLLRERAVPLTQKLNQFFATPQVSKVEGQIPPKIGAAKKLEGEATQVAEKEVY